MKGRHKIVLVAVLAAVMVLVVGIGYALAQSGQDNPQPAAGQQQGPGGPGPHGRARGHMVGGEVTKVEDNTITVKTPAGEEKSVKVDDKTRYVKQGGKATLDDVKTGEKVGFLLNKPADGSDPTAKAVMIGKPGDGGKRVVGEIIAINGDNVTIKTPNGDQQVTIPALTQGERIGVATGPDGTVRGVNYNPPERPATPPADAPEAPPAANGQGA